MSLNRYYIRDCFYRFITNKCPVKMIYSKTKRDLPWLSRCLVGILYEVTTPLKGLNEMRNCACVTSVFKDDDCA